MIGGILCYLGFCRYRHYRTKIDFGTGWVYNYCCTRCKRGMGGEYHGDLEIEWDR